MSNFRQFCVDNVEAKYILENVEADELLELNEALDEIQVKLDEDVRYMNTEKVVFDRFDGFCDCCGYSGQTAIRFMRLETDNEIKKRVGKNE